MSESIGDLIERLIAEVKRHERDTGEAPVILWRHRATDWDPETAFAGDWEPLETWLQEQLEPEGQEQ